MIKVVGIVILLAKSSMQAITVELVIEPSKTKELN
jgi:hypothetical protein